MHKHKIEADEEEEDLALNPITSLTGAGRGEVDKASSSSKAKANSTHKAVLRKRNTKHKKYSQNNMECSLSDGELQYSYYEDPADSTFSDSDSSDYSSNDDDEDDSTNLFDSNRQKEKGPSDEISGVVISSVDDSVDDAEDDGAADSGVPQVPMTALNKFGKKIRRRQSTDTRKSLDEQGKSKYPQARAIFSYTATNPRELTIKVGDIITVTDKSDLDWWNGYLPNGKHGIFPSNYCREIKAKQGPFNIKKKNVFSKFFCGYGEETSDSRKHLLCRCCPKNNEIVLHKMFLYFLLCGVKNYYYYKITKIHFFVMF